MATESAPGAVRAVLFDLDDVLVPFHTVRAFQWAWKPQGPVLGERHAQSAIRRSLHAWDRRRWSGLTGRSPPADLAALHEHLASTLREVAGHAVPAEESEAVVRRLLRPAGEVERYPEVAGVLDRLARRGVRSGVITPLPEASARWLLHRVGIDEQLLLGWGDGDGPVAPARDAYRAAAERFGPSVTDVAFVGDLFWSDVRAAQRAGLRGVLVDRHQGWPHVQLGRIANLSDLEAVLAQPEAKSDAPEPSPPSGPARGGPPSGGLL